MNTTRRAAIAKVTNKIFLGRQNLLMMLKFVVIVLLLAIVEAKGNCPKGQEYDRKLKKCREDCFLTYGTRGEFTTWDYHLNKCRRDCRFYRKTPIWNPKKAKCVAKCGKAYGTYYDPKIDDCRNVCDSCLFQTCIQDTGFRCHCPYGFYFDLKYGYCRAQVKNADHCLAEKTLLTSCPTDATCKALKAGLTCECNKGKHIEYIIENSRPRKICVKNYCRPEDNPKLGLCQECSKGMVFVGQLCVKDCRTKAHPHHIYDQIFGYCRPDCARNKMVWLNFKSKCARRCLPTDNDLGEQKQCFKWPDETVKAWERVFKMKFPKIKYDD